VDMSEKPFNMVNPADYPSYWELLNQVVQEEPSESLDQIRLGYYASIGIQKGKPFSPDDRMKKILTEAAAVGDATARAVAFHMRDRDDYYYANSNWQLPFVGGYKFQSQPGVLNLDGYIFYYFMATGVTPAMEMKMVGLGSQYPWMGARITRCICRPISRSKISGRLLSTRIKPVRWSRPTRNSLASAVKPKAFK
jgi:hypothetical protein